jgi:hypothetical protein
VIVRYMVSGAKDVPTPRSAWAVLSEHTADPMVALPRKGDVVYIAGKRYVVREVAWTYDLSEDPGKPTGVVVYLWGPE